MGKFNLKKLKQERKRQEKLERLKIKRALRKRPLIRFIPDNSDPEDGVLLFGKFEGSKISDLMGNFDHASYVTGFLMDSDMLPSKFRESIGEIVTKFDPCFDSDSRMTGPNIKEVFEDDDIPW